MTKRQGITDKMKVDCLLYRYEIPCAGCGERIMIEQDVIQWDHVWEVADDGPHTFTNLRPLHVECHKLKSAIAESQRSRIDRLEKEKRGLPKRKRQSRPMKSGKTVWPKRAFPRQCA